jgi:hypothetical protein
VNTGTSFSVTFGAQPGHRVRDLLLRGKPSEELLQRPVLVAGIRVAVPGQQMDQPPLHVVAVYLLPPGPGGAGDQVGGGEPCHCVGVGPHRLGRLALGGQVQPERADLTLENPGVKRLPPPGTRLRDGHCFSLFLRFR